MHIPGMQATTTTTDASIKKPYGPGVIHQRSNSTHLIRTINGSQSPSMQCQLKPDHTTLSTTRNGQLLQLILNSAATKAFSPVERIYSGERPRNGEYLSFPWILSQQRGVSITCLAADTRNLIFNLPSSALIFLTHSTPHIYLLAWWGNCNFSTHL